MPLILPLALRSPEPLYRLTRTLVYEGTGSWIDATLALNALGPARPQWVQSEGTITEVLNVLVEVPAEKESKREPKSKARTETRSQASKRPADAGSTGSTAVRRKRTAHRSGAGPGSARRAHTRKRR